MNKILDWLLRLTASIILLQTLYFKFSGAEESIYIFSTLGIEPWGRIGAGITELILSILILIPKTTWIGSIGAIGVMLGAILAHLTLLGVIINNDGGTLFVLAIVVLAVSVINLIRQKQYIILFVEAIRRK